MAASVEQDQTAAWLPPGWPARPAATVVLDLLFASSGIEAEIAAAAEPIEIVSGLRVRTAATGHLIALKLLARDDTIRPQDLSDLRALRAVAADADLEVARQAIGLISARGCDRGRDRPPR